MHPPGKRSISISDWKNTMQNHVETHPPGKRSMDINTWQNYKAILNRYTRAGAAATSYKRFVYGSRPK